jgi:hypothetical protein
MRACPCHKSSAQLEPLLGVKPDFAEFLRRLYTGRGLYFLGAGASAGEAPFGVGFLRDPLIDFLRYACSFSVTKPERPPLSRRLLVEGGHLTAYDIYSRTLRPGTEDWTQELLQLLPPNFPRSYMMHQLAKARYRGRVSHNYLPFRFAPRSLFMNYNHDGLATDLVGSTHSVIAVHGSVDPWIGAPEALEIIRTAGIEYNLAIAPDQLLMLEPESYFDLDLASRLLPMARFRPEFVAIIGYSFAWTGQRHDDAVSLDCFIDHYHEFCGPVFVVEPLPERLQETLAERLHLARVIAIPARWNLLAHAFLKMLAGCMQGVTLNDYCSALYDRGFGDQAYPVG